MRNLKRLRMFFTVILLLSACAPVVNASQNGKLTVGSTVSPIKNIIYNVGGDRINLSGIVPDGVNSHTFEPAPPDAVKLARADLIFVNGLHLEHPTLKLSEVNKNNKEKINTL